MELYGSEFLISHTFQCKRYISIARTGNFIMYALGPFSQKRSHIPVYICMQVYACVNMCPCEHVCIQVCVCVSMCTCECEHVYM